jgi:hypothetical protein
MSITYWIYNTNKLDLEAQAALLRVSLDVESVFEYNIKYFENQHHNLNNFQITKTRHRPK